MIRTHAALLAVVAAAGCSTDEPSVIVAVVSEGTPPLGTTLDSVRLTSTRLGSASMESRLTEVPARYEGDRLVPITTRLTPEREGDPGRTLYRIRAEGLAGGRVIVAAQHRVAFVSGRTVPLAFHLEGTCVDVSCAGDLTCASGGCVDDFIPSCVLLGDDDPSCARDSGPGPTPNDLGPDLVGPDAGPDADVAEAGPDDLGPNEDFGPLVLDAGDSGPDDSGLDDSGPEDSDAGDIGPPDLGPPDTGPVDAGPCPAGCGVNAVCGASGCVCEPGFQSCDGMPGCESTMATDALHCGSCATACGPEAPSCIGSVCVMCTAAGDCDDGLGCTTDSCSAGTCVHTLIASRCLIDGSCRTSGASNGPCQTCDPARSTTAWSNVANGRSCNDGQFCTLDDACMGGTCTGTGSPCGDNITYRCVPHCDEATDSCSATFGGANTYCYIDRTCVHESWGDLDPNQCLGCEPSVDRFELSPRMMPGGGGDVCDDGLFCTATDICTLTATPACVGSGARCDDGLSCTSDSCNEGSNSCTNTVAAGFCAIGGVCYAQGTFNPTNECERCTPATSQTAWSSRPNGAVCGGGYSSCCSGTCHACDDSDCACAACTGGTTCGEGVAGRCLCM